MTEPLTLTEIAAMGAGLAGLRKQLAAGTPVPAENAAFLHLLDALRDGQEPVTAVAGSIRTWKAGKRDSKTAPWPAPAANDTLTLAAAATAIGVLTARIRWPGVTQAESLGAEPPEPVIKALALICERFLAATFPDQGTAFLERLASDIAAEAAR